MNSLQMSSILAAGGILRQITSLNTLSLSEDFVRAEFGASVDRYLFPVDTRRFNSSYQFCTIPKCTSWTQASLTWDDCVAGHVQNKCQQISCSCHCTRRVAIVVNTSVVPAMRSRCG
jgi:hypothetical protein